MALAAIVAGLTPVTAAHAATGAPIQFSSSTFDVAENAGALNVTITRANKYGSAPTRKSTVKFATTALTASAGKDFTSVAQTVTFASRQTQAVVSVPIINDSVHEGDEMFTMALSSPTNGSLGQRKTATATIHDDDPVPVISIDDPAAVPEGSNIPFTLSISNPSSTPVSVNYATTGGTATPGQDITATNGTATIPPGAMSTRVNVPTIQDGIPEATESVILELSSPVNGVIGDAAGTGTILDDDPVPVLSAENASAVNEGGRLTFTVRLSSVSGQQVSAAYKTLTEGTATSGSDFTPAAGRVVIPPGALSAIFTVDTLDDRLHEDAETVVVELSDPLGASIGAAKASGVIADDDSAPQLAIDGASATEGGPLDFQVHMTSASGAPVTVQFDTTTAGTATVGADFAHVSSLLTIPAGSTSTSVTVPTLQDGVYEGDETVVVQLSSPVGATVGASRATGTIHDDDTPPVLSIGDPPPVTEGNPVTFTVSLSSPVQQPVTVGYATPGAGSATSGTDYTATSGTLTIPAGASTGTFTVGTVQDALHENPETFGVVLSNPVNATLGTSTATATINDDDGVPSLSIEAPQPVSEGLPLTFTVRASAPSGAPITVSAATTSAGTATPGSDFTATSQALTIPTGQTTATFTVGTLQDTLPEASETVVVTLSGASGATIATGTAVGTIVDDDAAPTVSIGTPAAVSEGSPVTFTVTLSRASGTTVSVDYATTTGGTATPASDYAPSSGTLVIPAGSTTGTFSVATIDDSLTEQAETFVVQLSNARNAVIATGQAMATINDNDVVLPELSIDDPAPVPEGNAVVFTVSISQASTQAVSAAWATRNGTTDSGDLAAQHGTATIPAGQTSVSISVSTIDDTLKEPSQERFSVDLSNPVGATIAKGTGTGTLLDNETCGKGDYPNDLGRILANLDPNGDADGDGFTNGEEMGRLAFDPRANPARFSPLVADAPELAMRINGDITVELLDDVSKTTGFATTVFDEKETARGTSDSTTDSVTEGHHFNFELSGTVGQQDGKDVATVSPKASYGYDKETTHEHTVETSEGERTDHQNTINTAEENGHTVNGGIVKFSATVRNLGHVDFQIEEAGLGVHSVDSSGRSQQVGLAHADVPGDGVFVTAGGSVELAFQVLTQDGSTVIGGSTAKRLAADTSSLVITPGTGFLLSKVGSLGLFATTGSFGQYKQSIAQNTAEVDIDYGTDDAKTMEEEGNQKLSVSTTYQRDQFGFPTGTPLCTALGTILGKDTTVSPVPISGKNASGANATITANLVSQMDGAPESTTANFAGDTTKNAKWIMAVDSASTAQKPTINGIPVAGVGDVNLRAGEGASLVFATDEDGDGLTARQERHLFELKTAGATGVTEAFDCSKNWDGDGKTCDHDPDSDNDGLNDHAESCPNLALASVEVEPCAHWTVETKNFKGQKTTYEVGSSPAKADADGDGLRDPDERTQYGATGTDPDRADTDGDGLGDQTDPSSGPNGLTGRYYSSDTNNFNKDVPSKVFHQLLNSRIDPIVNFDWGMGSPDSLHGVPASYFAVKWTGFLKLPSYFAPDVCVTLGAFHDDGIRIKVNDVLVLDKWVGYSDTADFVTPDHVLCKRDQGAQGFKLDVDYYAGGAPSAAKLLLPAGPVPQAWLYPDPTVPPGVGSGLSGRYYKDTNGDGEPDGEPLVARTDPNVDFNWGDGRNSTPGTPDPNVPIDHFSAKWTGSVTVPTSGPYYFGATSDDGVRVTVDNTKVVDKWLTRGAPSTPDYGLPVSLTAGQPVPIQVDYYEWGGSASIRLYQRGPDGETVVPSSWLTVDPAVTPRASSPLPDGYYSVKDSAGFNVQFDIWWDNDGHCSSGGQFSEGQSKSCGVPGTAVNVHVKIQAWNGSSYKDLKDTTTFFPERHCYEVTGNLGSESVSDNSC